MEYENKVCLSSGLQEVRVGMCLQDFFYLKQENGNDVIALYKPSYHAASFVLDNWNLWTLFFLKDLAQCLKDLVFDIKQL